MANKINLSDNHKRVISTTLKITEQSINEIIFLLNKDSDTFINLENDIDICKKKDLINSIRSIKSKMAELMIKYGLEAEICSFQQILNAKKSYLWSILCDTYSNKLDKYGTFDDNLRSNFDKDIDSLLNMINSL